MKRNGRDSIFKRFVGGGTPPPHEIVLQGQHVQDDAPLTLTEQIAAVGHGGLTGAALEQAYRNLLLENVMLSERNERLHERLARQQGGLEESPAARELIRAQRAALAERSHRMRELEYENQQLKRDKKKLVAETQRLTDLLQQRPDEAESFFQREAAYRRELAETKAALQDKKSELLKLTDRYYQLEAQHLGKVPTSSAANGEF